MAQLASGLLGELVATLRRLPGVDTIRLPGERGFACLAESQKAGVPIDDSLRESLDAMADEADVQRL